jgi:hypothetical protein
MHQAWVPFFEGEQAALPAMPPDEDIRWPSTCKCAEALAHDSIHQVFELTLYRTADGREFTLRDAPVGAMFHADWISGVPEWNRANDPKGPLHWEVPNPEYTPGEWI